MPVLTKNIPSVFGRYVEPFCGSACLFFETSNKEALLSDINHDLINALDEIKKNKNLRSLLIDMENTEENYYRIRSLDPEKLNKTDRAVRFLYLNRYCFNGVYRTNKSGKFNVPRGTKTGSFPSQEVFDLAREKLKHAELTVADYKQTLKRLREGDFVYIDPPYSKHGKFTGEYGPESFNSSCIPNFIDELSLIDSRGVKFLFSYRACDETISLLKECYNVETVAVKRHVSGFKTGWNEAKEILVRNYG